MAQGSVQAPRVLSLELQIQPGCTSPPAPRAWCCLPRHRLGAHDGVHVVGGVEGQHAPWGRAHRRGSEWTTGANGEVAWRPPRPARRTCQEGQQDCETAHGRDRAAASAVRGTQGCPLTQCRQAARPQRVWSVSHGGPTPRLERKRRRRHTWPVQRVTEHTPRGARDAPPTPRCLTYWSALGAQHTHKDVRLGRCVPHCSRASARRAAHALCAPAPHQRAACSTATRALCSQRPPPGTGTT